MDPTKPSPSPDTPVGPPRPPGRPPAPKTPPAPPSRWRRWARALGRLALGIVLVMTTQVLFVRFLNPPFTWTMVGVALQHDEDGALRWVDYRPLPLADLGRQAPRMAVASEDGWFWQHGGFDLGQMTHAVRDALRGRDVRGASTISQQVARNAFLWQGAWTPVRALRKGLEIPYTVLLELLVPKERILELYLNIAETGPHTFGVEAGAQLHFGKPAAELTATEAARLIAVLPAPRTWDPKGAVASERVGKILDNRVPFPGDEGFEAMQEAAWDAVGPGALWHALTR